MTQIMLTVIAATLIATTVQGQIIDNNQIVGVIPNYYQQQYRPNLIPINYPYRTRQNIARIPVYDQAGRYNPDRNSGRYIHDDSGRYVHDHSGQYDHTDKLAGHYDHTDRLKGIYDHRDRIRGQYDPRLHQDYYIQGQIAGQSGLNIVDQGQLGGVTVTTTPAPTTLTADQHALLGQTDGSYVIATQPGAYGVLPSVLETGNEIGSAASRSETRVGGNLFGADAQQRFSNNYWRILKYANDQYEDGYHYLYETENGINAEEEGHLENKGTDQEGIRAQGYFSYTGPDNVVYTVRYIADKDGFQPEGAHLPTPPPIPPAIQRSLEYQRSLGLI